MSDFKPSDHIIKLRGKGGDCGIGTPEMLQFNQRNMDAGALLETAPGASQQEGSLMTVPQSILTPGTPQGKRQRITPNQIEVPCEQCGTPLYYYPSQLRGGERHFCDRHCLGKWRSTQTDSKAAHWKGGEKIEGGRVYWFLPWHPRADRKGYVARAIIVAEMKYRRTVEAAEIVHHKDEDKSNDHPDNLEILPDQSAHARLHGLNRSPEQMEAMRAAKRGAA